MFATVVRISRLFVFVSWFCSNWSSVSIPNVAESRPLADPIFLGRSQVTQVHCVCHIAKYTEHMRRSLGLKICSKMEIKIDKTYHVVSCCCL